MKQKSSSECMSERNISALFFLFFFLMFLPDLYAQSDMKVQIRGTVKDALTNETLPGVNIIPEGTSAGTVTDSEGKFSFEAAKGTKLVFSFIGYEPSVFVVKTNQTVQLNLKAVNASLDEVVVIGYGNTTKKEVTGSISTVKSKDYNKGVFNDPMGLLQGKVAGLSIVNPNGADPQAKYEIILRGTNTLTSWQRHRMII